MKTYKVNCYEVFQSYATGQSILKIYKNKQLKLVC